MTHDALFAFERISLDRLRLAAEVILSEAEVLPDPLTAELTLFKERVERVLLMPAAPEPGTGSGPHANLAARAYASQLGQP